jgi:hypothetical protein
MAILMGAHWPGQVSLVDPPHVSFGSKTELSPLALHVRSTLKSRHRQTAPACPFRAKDRDRGEPRGSSPPTPPDIRVRIRRFDGISTVGVSRRAGESNSGVRRNGFGPFERRIRASPFLIAAKASDLDIRPHGRCEVSMSKRPSIVQAFSETRSAYYALS